jgi:hypothetical protein
MILHVLMAMVAGWVQRHQQQVITYLIEENRVLKAQLGGRRLRLSDTERRRFARPPPWPRTPQSGGDHRHARHPHALGQATDRPEV